MPPTCANLYLAIFRAISNEGIREIMGDSINDARAWSQKYNVANLKVLKYFRYVLNTNHCATSRTVPGSIPGGINGDFFFRGSPDRTMCPEVDSASESEYQGFLLW